MTKANRMELFKKIVSMWPKDIDVTEKMLFKDGGATILSLSDIHDEIESTLINNGAGSDLLDMDWAVYTVLHKTAREVDALRVDELSFKEVDEVFLENKE